MFACLFVLIHIICKNRIRKETVLQCLHWSAQYSCKAGTIGVSWAVIRRVKAWSHHVWSERLQEPQEVISVFRAFPLLLAHFDVDNLEAWQQEQPSCFKKACCALLEVVAPPLACRLQAAVEQRVLRWVSSRWTDGGLVCATLR